MCGICGVAAPGIKDVPDRQVLVGMCDEMVHRGPDEQGVLAESGVGLGIRRLAIIDPSGGHQPVSNEARDVHAICNGEIYNYRELRELLRSAGHAFRSDSDAEVIPHLYEEYGDAFVQQLTGMFGLALWDVRNQRLLLARDRMGQKPIYYSHDGDTLVFASELKAMLRHPSILRAIDLDALAMYLLYEYVPSPHSIIRGVKKLEAAHLLRFDGNGLETHAYWQLDLSGRGSGLRDTESAATELRQRLRESVRSQLISDVPLGVFLSGGIDSSAIAALMCDVSDSPVLSFSVAFEEPSFDESSHARLVARHLGTEHREITLDPQAMLGLVPGIAALVDEPLADASIVPTYLLSKFTREHVTVALGGDGGDELLAGYPTHQAYKLAGPVASLPGGVRRALRALANRLPVSRSNISFDFKAKRFMSAVEAAPEVRNALWLGSFGPDAQQSLLTSEVREALTMDPLDVARFHAAAPSVSDDLQRILYVDTKMYLQDDILAKVDRASMACSLEARAPFLDHTLVEYIAGLPVSTKLAGLKTKYLLKKAMRDMLPRQTVGRAKKGFGIPVAHWLRDELREMMLDLLSPASLRAAGLFDSDYVGSLVRDHDTGVRDNRKELWTLMVFELWRREYVSG